LLAVSLIFVVEFTTSVNDYGDETNISSEYHEY